MSLPHLTATLWKQEKKTKKKTDTISKRGKVQGNVVVYWSDWTGERKKKELPLATKDAPPHRALNGASALLGGRLMWVRDSSRIRTESREVRADVAAITLK